MIGVSRTHAEAALPPTDIVLQGVIQGPCMGACWELLVQATNNSTFDSVIVMMVNCIAGVPYAATTTGHGLPSLAIERLWCIADVQKQSAIHFSTVSIPGTLAITPLGYEQKRGQSRSDLHGVCTVTFSGSLTRAQRICQD